MKTTLLSLDEYSDIYGELLIRKHKNTDSISFFTNESENQEIFFTNGFFTTGEHPELGICVIFINSTKETAPLLQF